MNWPCRIYERAGQLPKADEDFPDQIHEGIRPDAWDFRNRGDMRIAVMSETTWVEEWRRAIVQAAESRKQGMLYPADRAAARSIEQRNVERALEYRQRTVVAGKGGFVDSTIGLVRGVSDAIRASQMAAGWGGNT